MCHAASDDFGHRAAAQRLRAQLAAQLQRRVDAQSGADVERSERGDVERARWVAGAAWGLGTLTGD